MARRRGVWAELQRERDQRKRVVDQARRAAVRNAAQAQREQEKLQRQREREDAASERERKRLYIDDRKAEAADLTATVAERIRELESLLQDGLAEASTVSFEAMKQGYEPPVFDPDGHDQPLPAPQWDDFAPPPPSLMGRLTGGGAQHRRAVETKQQEFEQACARHELHEAKRKRELRRLRSEHQQAVASGQRAYDDEVDQYAADIRAGDQECVEALFQGVLDDSVYPEGFVNLTRVVYLPHARDLVIEFELPSQQIIPTAREHRYVQTRDEIDALPRPTKEVKERYADLIAQVALRTIHEVFEADPVGAVATVTFVGLVSTVDPATGQPSRPTLLSVGVERERFDELNLTSVNPRACLQSLNALVSPHPYDLEPVAPIVDFEALLKQYRFIDGIDVLASFDSRQDLLKLKPAEFEQFTRQLFEKMGMKAWNTVVTKDDGVDAVATSEVPVFGGLCVIQAKRYSGAVGQDAIKALAATMEDKHATKGVMVTTSWVTRGGHAFAKRHGRIEIFEHRELKGLCQEHLGLDVLISLPKAPPPNRK